MAGNPAIANDGPAAAYVGELGLDGSVRAVRGIIGKILAGRSHGISQFYIPDQNLSQAELIPNITIFPVQSLRQLYDHLTGNYPSSAA